MDYHAEFDLSGGMIAGMFAGEFISSGLTIALYVLQALGLYTIAQRRGIRNPWMAWVPVLNLWILGCIADQYRYVVKGQIRNRRKVLLGLNIATAALWIALMSGWIAMVVKVLLDLDAVRAMTEAQLGELVASQALVLLAAALGILAVGVAEKVFRYISCYDLYASCQPDNKVLFLVLSILLDVTMPVFIFACRNKDLGMPPRKSTVPPEMQDPPMIEEE